MREHAKLCALAVRWLRRPYSAGGHGCQVAVSETKADWSGEIPDAIGFRAGHCGGSVVVECKTSRSDFLADRAKPHRAVGGMGTWRYFMAPAGLIAPQELPPLWGLIEVGARDALVVRAGAMIERKNCEVRAQNMQTWRCIADHDSERELMTRLLARVGNPENVQAQIREARTWARNALARSERLKKSNDDLRHRLWEQQRSHP
jgi:hypothetical protein